MKIVYMTTLATVLLSGTTFADTALNSNDLKQMHETYAANQARFAHDFVGKTFAASMLVSNITENLLNKGSYLVTLGLMNPLIFAGTHIGQISWTNDSDREFHPSEAWP
jgi:hypothetical protein